MDNVIREAVQQFMLQNGNSSSFIQTQTTETPSNHLASRAERQETRLSGLLNRIRGRRGQVNNTANDGRQSTKCKILQFKWQKYDFDTDSYHSVRVNNGGGSRFLKVTEDDTFKNVKENAISLVYDNNLCNFFGENKDDTIFSIANATGSDLDEKETIADYLKRKGQVLSKTFFILKTQAFPIDLMDDLPSVLSIPMLPTSICKTCSRTTVIGDDCLFCQQNMEFEESLDKDMFVNETSNCENEDLSRGDLRERRLAHFTSLPVETSSDDVANEITSLKVIILNRSKIKLDLIHEFKEKKCDRFLSSEDLLHSFMNYVSKDERSIITQILDEKTDADFFATDEVLEFLEQFKCRSLLKKENARELVFELARQEILQKPHLMASCMKKHLRHLCENDVSFTKETLKALYEYTKPTSKKVIKLLNANPIDESERESLAYLKRYIRGLDDKMLKKFLKFVTGSETIVVNSIDITFLRCQSEFERRPIAHTCTPSLELPSTYKNLCELREEFENILNVSYWEMNIV